MEPCAVIATSCPTITPQRIISGILGCPESSLPPSQGIDTVEGVQAYPWEIQTKYYDARVHLCAMEQKTIGCQEFADHAQAAILCFDSNSKDGLSEVAQWLPFITEFRCDVKILVCENCCDDSVASTGKVGNNTGIDRVTAVSWCIKHGFELVELNPQVDEADESDLEDDFPETLGIKRIVQALEAHIWPNLIRKGNLGTSREPPKAAFAAQSPKVEETTKLNNSNAEENERFDTPTASDEEAEENDLFEALFQQLSTMKSKASDLPPEDRKDYAEKMAVAFWRAMGGDETEIEDLGMGGDSSTADSKTNE